jgi:hypothetical protein
VKNLVSIIKDNIVFFSVICIISVFYFFQIYRIYLFNTLPHDAYHTIVDYWLGNVGMDKMWSPTFYRVLYGYSASLIYKYGLNPIILSNIDAEVSSHVVRLYFSLSIVAAAFILMHLLSVYIYFKDCYSRSSAMLLTFIASLLLNFSAFFGIDAMTICWLFWLLVSKDKLVYFIPLIFVSFLVNEKVCVLSLIYFGTLVIYQKGYMVNFILSALSCFLFFLLVKAIPLPGYEEQKSVFSFFYYIPFGINYLFTAKGIFLNLIPLIIFLYLGYLKYITDKINFLSCGLPTIFMIALGLSYAGNPSLDGEYVIGRYMMHLLPFYYYTIIDEIKFFSN